MGTIGWLLFAALAAWQLLLGAGTVTMAENAARTAARAASVGENGVAAAEEALPTWLRGPDSGAQINGTRATVSVSVPVVLPGISVDGLRLTREAEFPPNPASGVSPGAAGGARANLGRGRAPTSAGRWDALADCESGGDWAINTGNGYFGGLQFSASSWRLVGGKGLPHQASKEEQIRRGEELRRRQGWGAWPVCSRMVGLR